LAKFCAAPVNQRQHQMRVRLTRCCGPQTASQPSERGVDIERLSCGRPGTRKLKFSLVAHTSQYKDYVLILLFVKYVSDKYAGDHSALIDVPFGGSFADMVAAKEDKEIGDKINK
jgi:hypothetical protein